MNPTMSIIVVCAVIFQLASAAPNSRPCHALCTREYSPVCGQNNFGTQQTFTNECLFEYEDCSNRAAGWKISKPSACEEDSSMMTCAEACTYEFRPVCGQDNTGKRRTFANKCMFEREECQNRDAGWHLAFESACDQKVKQCSEVCTYELKPVCGQDNTGKRRTFANKCMFEREECQNRDAGWRFIKESACDQVPVLRRADSKACRGLCTREWEPICGVNNYGSRQTFNNECLFDYEQCNNRAAGWKIIKRNSCSEM